MNRTVKLTAETAPLEAALAEAKGLIEGPLQLPQELRDRLVRFGNSPLEIASIKPGAATGADEVRVTFDVSERFRELLAALRARDRNRRVA